MMPVYPCRLYRLEVNRAWCASFQVDMHSQADEYELDVSADCAALVSSMHVAVKKILGCGATLYS